MTVAPFGDEFLVLLHKVEDVGDAGFADVSEFPPVNEDEYVGEGRVVATVGDAAAALASAEECLGAHSGRWVNASLVGDEYLDFKSGKEGR
ncbi:MAG TPA: hypothetical protein VM287_06000 [Egibacteraceae bacterium]|nr:hypothetical protein [Egibacteraceae bacterium]